MISFNAQSSANSILREIASSDKMMKKYLERMSSGLRINSASDDPAGLAISEKMRSQVQGYNMEIRNLQDQVSYLQTYDGAAASVTDMTQRIRELSVQAGNGTYTDSDRAIIQDEIDQLTEGIADISNNSEYNTIKIGEDLSLEALGLSSIDVVGNPEGAITMADDAISQVSSQRAASGATVNTLEHTINNKHTAMLNTMAAESQIRDLDYAAAAIDMNTEALKQEVQLMSLAHANMSRSNAFHLLFGQDD